MVREKTMTKEQYDLNFNQPVDPHANDHIMARVDMQHALDHWFDLYLADRVTRHVEDVHKSFWQYLGTELTHVNNNKEFIYLTPDAFERYQRLRGPYAVAFVRAWLARHPNA